MGWREEWQKASFRGVEFRFKVAGAMLGRRNVFHTYPGRDDPFPEDLGRKEREFTLEAFVVGDDYIAQRDRLEAAIEQEGPGELVHPTRGRMQVSVKPASVTESIDALGVASFQLTFIQAGKNTSPTVTADTSAKVDIAANTALDAVNEDFSTEFEVDGQPDFVATDASTTIQGALDEVLASARGMIPDMSILPAFNKTALGIVNDLTSLMRIPVDLAGGTGGQISGLLGLANTPISAFKALKGLFDFGDDKPTVARTTPSRIQQANNRDAVHTLVQRTALITASQASARIDYASRSTYQ